MGAGRVPPLVQPVACLTDAVLCSEMGVCFSACGRYLAACVAAKVFPTMVLKSFKGSMFILCCNVVL